MVEFKITIDNMLSELSNKVKEKHFMSAHQWVDTAQKLNVLIGEEHDKLFDLEMDVAQRKVEFLQQGETVASANLRIDATELNKLTKKQKAKIKQVEEMIRIAKTQARLKDNEYRTQ